MLDLNVSDLNDLVEGVTASMGRLSDEVDRTMATLCTTTSVSIHEAALLRQAQRMGRLAHLRLRLINRRADLLRDINDDDAF